MTITSPLELQIPEAIDSFDIDASQKIDLDLCNPKFIQIFQAIRNKDIEMLGLLLRDDIDIVDGNGNSALHYSLICFNNHVLKYLLDSKANLASVNSKSIDPLELSLRMDNIDGYMLICATRKGIVVDLDDLGKIPSEIFCNLMKQLDFKPFLYLVIKSKTNLIDDVLDIFIGVENIIPERMLGFYNVLDEEIKDLKYIDTYSESQELSSITPLFLACMSDNFDLVDILLECKADVNAVCSLGDEYLNIKKCSPLMVCGYFENYEIMRALLQQGADPNFLSENEENIVDLISKKTLGDFNQLMLTQINFRDDQEQIADAESNFNNSILNRIYILLNIFESDFRPTEMNKVYFSNLKNISYMKFAFLPLFLKDQEIFLDQLKFVKHSLFPKILDDAEFNFDYTKNILDFFKNALSICEDRDNKMLKFYVINFLEFMKDPENFEKSTIIKSSNLFELLHFFPAKDQLKENSLELYSEFVDFVKRKFIKEFKDNSESCDERLYAEEFDEKLANYEFLKSDLNLKLSDFYKKSDRINFLQRFFNNEEYHQTYEKAFLKTILAMKYVESSLKIKFDDLIILEIFKRHCISIPDCVEDKNSIAVIYDYFTKVHDKKIHYKDNTKIIKAIKENKRKLSEIDSEYGDDLLESLSPNPVAKSLKISSKAMERN